MVDINEFCRVLRVERSPFVERLFAMFDTDRGGLIDLKEFVVGALLAAAPAPKLAHALVSVSAPLCADRSHSAAQSSLGQPWQACATWALKLETTRCETWF